MDEYTDKERVIKNIQKEEKFLQDSAIADAKQIPENYFLKDCSESVKKESSLFKWHLKGEPVNSPPPFYYLVNIGGYEKILQVEDKEQAKKEGEKLALSFTGIKLYFVSCLNGKKLSELIFQGDK